MSESLLDPSQLLAERGRWCLVDARATDGARAGYATCHLAGAKFVELATDLSRPVTDPAVGGRHPLPSLADFSATLGRLGITPATPVAIYDAAGGALAAARMWWMLRAVGHRAVALVDGGFQRAVAVGFPTSTEVPPAGENHPYPTPRAWLLPTVDRLFVAAHQHAANTVIVDVRSEARFLGLEEPIDPVAGHIPGATNMPYEQTLDARGCFESVAALRARFTSLLEPTLERVVVHCGSGVTACHTLFVLDLIGHHDAALYVGSWSEWCRSDESKSR